MSARTRRRVILVGYAAVPAPHARAAEFYFRDPLHRAAVEWARMQVGCGKARMWLILAGASGAVEPQRTLSLPECDTRYVEWLPLRDQRAWAAGLVAHAIEHFGGLPLYLEIHHWTYGARLLRHWCPAAWRVEIPHVGRTAHQREAWYRAQLVALEVARDRRRP